MDNLSTLTDQQLVPFLRTGSKEAFCEVYARYRNKVYSVALKMLRREADAEEIMQEVMLKLWLSAKNLKEDSNLDGYLKTITRNLSYNLIRRQVLEARTAITRGRNWKEFDNATEEQVLLGETRRILRDAIDHLPPQQKAVYRLCHEEGLKYEEAAKQLNLSTLTVKGYMKQALRSVRDYITLHTDIPFIVIMFGLLKK